MNSSNDRPNIVYLHSHDTGRYIEPFGHAVPTPNLQRLAEQGVLFRNNHCACPTCSPSRAALLTGTYPHQNGMIGLAHRGFSIANYGEHIVNELKPLGYHTVLAGIQHVASRVAAQAAGFDEPWQLIGYDECLGDREVAHDRAAEWISSLTPSAGSAAREPFFLSVGAFETHREFPDLADGDPEDPRYTLPPAPLPDTPETRADMAAYRKMARELDRKTGVVLDALDRASLADRTIVICTTDHGIAFPRMKCNLHDSGTGTFLIIRGPGGFAGGTVIDAMTSHLDIYPTVCALLGIDSPGRLEGLSLLPLIAGATKIHDELYSEVTYHAAYEPMRAVRTDRYKYIRRFDGRYGPVLPNVDNGPSKTVWTAGGWGATRPDEESLFDLMLDPNESRNLVGSAAHHGILNELRQSLTGWMQRTADPICAGHVLPPPGAKVTWTDASEPAGPIGVIHSAE